MDEDECFQLDYSLKLVMPPGKKTWDIHCELHGNLEPPQ